MANGTFFDANPDFGHGELIDDAEATADGVWLDVGRYAKASIQIAGITTATVDIRGSNAEAKPADNTHGTIIGSAVTADTFASVDPLPRWIKARVTAWTSGTVRVDIKAVD